MKGKNGSKRNTKHSLQKHSQLIIMHSYRHSNLSDTLPFNYNDSLLSMRKNLLANQKKNYRFSNIKTQPAEKDVISSRKFAHQKKKSTQEKTNERSNKKYETKFKARRNSEVSCTQQGKPQKPKLTVSKKLKSSDQTNNLNSQQLESIENRARQVLSKYKIYTEYLQKEVKNYKFKYYSSIKMLKRLAKAQK